MGKYENKDLAWLVANFDRLALDSGYLKALTHKMANFFTALGASPQVKSDIEMINNRIIRNVPGGELGNPKDAILAAPEITNVWFMRSGGSVGGAKDFLVRRFGDSALSVYNVTDDKEIFSLDQDGVIQDCIVKKSAWAVPIFFDKDGITISDIGTSYTRILDCFSPWIDFSKTFVRVFRLVISAEGNETGTKGIRLKRSNDDVMCLCEWTDGETPEPYCGHGEWGGWDMSDAGDEEFEIEIKGASATEDIIITRILLEMAGG